MKVFADDTGSAPVRQFPQRLALVNKNFTKQTLEISAKSEDKLRSDCFLSRGSDKVTQVTLFFKNPQPGPLGLSVTAEECPTFLPNVNTTASSLL